MMGALRTGIAISALACGCVKHASNATDVDAATADVISPNGPFYDFPAQPIIDSSGGGPATPANIATQFGAPDNGTVSGGPCLVEPELGALFPYQGLRPRFNVSAGTQNVFELRLHSDHEVNDLIVYTNNPIWLLPTDMWLNLNLHIVDQDITVTLRAATTDGTTLTTPVTFGPIGTVRIAPATAGGAIVYWTPSVGTPPEGALKGFSFGDETVASVLTPTQGGATCIGCHTSTPDGMYAAFSARDNGAGDTAIAFRSVDGTATPAPYVSTAAQTLLARTEQELPIFSPAHWQTGDRVAVTLSPDLGSGMWDLYWTNLETASTAQGTGWDRIARTGDSHAAAEATFSHDGKSIVYTSESNAGAGVLPMTGDLYTIPWSGGAGGTATPLTGASDSTLNEFFPSYSPDDQLIAFTRYPIDGSQAYANPKSEVFTIPAAGGSPVRLTANDPPTCSGVTSPGITNSWPKWAPLQQTFGTKTYYWVAFSSSRGPGTNIQLYMTAVVVDGGTITTYPAFYLWNQPQLENNHTPAWDVFTIE